MILSKGNIAIGKDHIPYRKKPCLVVVDAKKGIEKKYATFNGEEEADEFMDILSKFVGAIKDGEQDAELEG